ncbi:hypothetical protein GCM10009854_02900 [Saccharopolyspora halophila]|uniref:DUF3017 domain-containing protein n=1 Tax=Saccharopolyspora halophila TaxID=405551 RepID=A0ABN3FJ93_9PSEU
MSERFPDRYRLSVHVPFALVGAIGLIGFLLVAMQHWRRGTVVLGLALLLAAVFRALVPEERTGLLNIRSRAVDILLYGGFGVVIISIAMTIRGLFG